METDTPALLIAKARKRKKLTQQKLADLLGIHFVTMSKIERGKTSLTVDLVLKIEELLGIPASRLINSSSGKIIVPLFGHVEGMGEVRKFYDGITHDIFSDHDLMIGERYIWLRIASDDLYPLVHDGDLLQVTKIQLTPEISHLFQDRVCLVRSEAEVDRMFLSVLSGSSLRKLNGSPFDVGPFQIEGFVSMTLQVGMYPRLEDAEYKN